MPRLHPVDLEHLAECTVQSLGLVVDVAGEGLHLGQVQVFRVADDLAEALDPNHCGAELMADASEELALQLVQAFQHGEVGHGGRLGLALQPSPPPVGEHSDRKHGCIEEEQAEAQHQVQLPDLPVDGRLHRCVGEVKLKSAARR